MIFLNYLSCTFRPELELVQVRNGSLRVPRNSASTSSSSPSFHVKKFLDPLCPYLNLISLAVYMISISLDACFFYLLVIDDYRKCLSLDKDMALTLGVLRSFFDTLYIFYLYYYPRLVPNFIHGRGFNTSNWAVVKKYIFSINGIISILPLPQVVLFIVVPKMSGSKYLSAMSTLKYLLLAQFLPRSICMYQLFTNAATSPGLFAVGLANAVFNFLVYLLVGHVFGALWYFLAIERVSVCWKQACIHASCSNDSFYCNDKFGDHSILNVFCPLNIRDSTSFDFGMFQDALQSGIVVVTNFPQKLLYCLQWGIRNLSLSQNFQTSAYVGESCFSLVMNICGAVLIPSLLANVMQYLQHINRNAERIRLKMQEIEHWRLFQVLSNNLKLQIRNYCRSVCQETEGFNVYRFFDDLPWDLSWAMKYELCLSMLKQVPMFRRMDEQHLSAILDHFKLVPYTQGRLLVQEGNPVNKLQLIVGGNTLSSTSNSRRSSYFCGEELVQWAVDFQPYGYGFPISTRTVEAVTMVEAFSIEAYDLKEFVNQFRLPNGKLPTIFKYDSGKWRNWAATIIQAWYRQRKKKLQSSLPAVNAPRFANGAFRAIRPEAT